MRLKFSIMIILLLGLAALAAAQDGNGDTSETVAVEQIYLAKDDGEGKAGDVVESFLTADIPIYCIVELSSTKQAVIKMNLMAVSVAGVRAETKVISVVYKTNGRQNRVNFTGRPDGLWTAGTYRFDIFVDDKLAGSQKFEIRKSPIETPQKIAPGVNPVKPSRTKNKQRTARSTRKN